MTHPCWSAGPGHVHPNALHDVLPEYHPLVSRDGFWNEQAELLESFFLFIHLSKSMVFIKFRFKIGLFTYHIDNFLIQNMFSSSSPLFNTAMVNSKEVAYIDENQDCPLSVCFLPRECPVFHIHKVMNDMQNQGHINRFIGWKHNRLDLPCLASFGQGLEVIMIRVVRDNLSWGKDIYLSVPQLRSLNSNEFSLSHYN